MKPLNGQFCPICDIWVDISSDHPIDGDWAESDFEDFHLWQKQWTDEAMNKPRKDND